MSWKDELKPASFKGVPFRVDASAVEFGFNVQINEIATGQLPVKEGETLPSVTSNSINDPLVTEGAKGAKVFIVEAHFTGDDYIANRDAFIAACEAGGVGVLQLPLMKPTNVVASRGVAQFSNTSGGHETLGITFIETTAKPKPETSANEKKVADAIVTAGETSIASKFASAFDKTVAGASSLAEAVSGKMLDVLGFGEAGDSFSDFVSKATSLSDDARTIIQTPQRFAEEILDAVADLTYAFTNPIDALNAQLFIFETYRTGLQLTLNGSESRRKTVENNQAVALAFESACVMQAGIAALNADFDTLDDAIRVRSEFETAVKTQKERLGDIEGYDAVYNSLSTLLGSVTRYINDTASLPSSIDIEFGDENPSLVIAADYYGDAERESELVTRNAVRNPLFCKREMEGLSE